MYCGMFLIYPSIASGQSCQFRAHCEHVNMNSKAGRRDVHDACDEGRKRVPTGNLVREWNRRFEKISVLSHSFPDISLSTISISSYGRDFNTLNSVQDGFPRCCPTITKQGEWAPPQRFFITTMMFWDRKGVLVVEFMECDTTTTSSSYSVTLERLRRPIQNKHRGISLFSIVLLHANEQPHIAATTKNLPQRFRWTIFNYRLYSPELTPF